MNNPTPAVFEVLRRAGADVNAKDMFGRTPLHWAAAYNPSPAVIKLLLKAGADPRAIDNAGKTPPDVAKLEYRDFLRKAIKALK
jgi:ankyrin repeat protein